MPTFLSTASFYSERSEHLPQAAKQSGTVPERTVPLARLLVDNLRRDFSPAEETSVNTHRERVYKVQVQSKASALPRENVRSSTIKRPQCHGVFNLLSSALSAEGKAHKPDEQICGLFE
jgi:hypothetical protein